VEDKVKNKKQIISGSMLMVLILMAGFAIAGNLEEKKLKRAILKIESLSCGGCFSAIYSGLSPLEGYSGMGTNLFRKLVAIDFSAPLTSGKIKEQLEKAGYPGTLKTIDDILEKESFAFLESRKTAFASDGSCCSDSAPQLGSKNQGSSGRIDLSGGSCCTLPGISQPTENL